MANPIDARLPAHDWTGRRIHPVGPPTLAERMAPLEARAAELEAERDEARASAKIHPPRLWWVSSDSEEGACCYAAPDAVAALALAAPDFGCEGDDDLDDLTVSAVTEEDVDRLHAEVARLDRILRCERGESAPEGWERLIFDAEGAGAVLAAVRIAWIYAPFRARKIGAPYVWRVRDGWAWHDRYVGERGRRHGVAPTAIEAIETASLEAWRSLTAAPKLPGPR